MYELIGESIYESVLELLACQPLSLDDSSSHMQNIILELPISFIDPLDAIQILIV